MGGVMGRVTGNNPLLLGVWPKRCNFKCLSIVGMIQKSEMYHNELKAADGLAR